MFVPIIRSAAGISILLGLTCLVLLGEANAVAEDVPTDVFLPIDAELIIIKRDPSAPKHKAVAIGPGRSAGFAAGLSSPELAVKAAVGRCEDLLSRAPYKSIRKRKCHPYMVNGTIVLPEKKPEYPIGTVLDGPDLPLKRPLYEQKPKGQLNGILLALHGCSRLRSIPQGQKRWFSYFESKGLYVIAPNSFAEPRLPERCPPTRGKNLAPLKTISHGGEIVRFRVAQTRRTIRLLREKYPDLPIIIWGHSEGGVVAQLIPDNVAGVIVSGALCGIRRSKDLMVKRNIPLLLLLGDKDTIVNPQKGETTELTKYCGEVLKSPVWKFVLLRGVGHTPNIRSNAVRRPISTFVESVLDQHSPH